jgi:hypothetical protein
MPSMSKLPSLSQQRYATYQHLELTPDYYMHLQSKSLTRQHEIRFDLFDLDLRPSTQSTSSGPLLLATGMVTLISFILLVLGLFNDFEGYLELFLTGASLAVVGGLLFWLSRKTTLVYHHRLSYEPLFEIRVFHYNKTKREFFVRQLNALLLRIAEHDRSSFYGQQNTEQQDKDSLSYN